MKTIYKSEVLNKEFETEEECLTAEKKYEEEHAKELAEKEERATRAREVNDAYKKYLELRAKFVEDYKNYHITLTSDDLPVLNKLNLWDLFDKFWF